MDTQAEIERLKSEVAKLNLDFHTHIVLSEERWNQMFRETKEQAGREADTIKEIKESIDRLNKLVWGVGGSTIFILTTTLLTGLLR